LITLVSVPRVNANENDAKVVSIVKNLGDEVTEGDTLLELETTKAISSVISPKSGYVVQLSVQVGDTVTVGQQLTVISDNPDGAVEIQSIETAAPRLPLLTTKARILARGSGLSESDFSHLDGRITTDDVQHILDNSSFTSEDFGQNLIPLDAVQLGMARTVRASQTSAVPAYLESGFNPTKVKIFAKQLQSEFGMLADPAVDIVAFAFVLCLSANPLLNSVIRGDKFQNRPDINLAVAVQAPSGLFMPVVQEASKMSLVEFVQASSTIKRQVFREKRDSSLFEHPTAGFTSLASQNILRHIPILLPNTSIMLAHSSELMRDNDEPFTIVGATYDHQLLSGGDVAQMLEQHRQLLDDPELLLRAIDSD